MRVTVGRISWGKEKDFRKELEMKGYSGGRKGKGKEGYRRGQRGWEKG